MQVEDNINGFIKKSELSKHKNEQKIEKFAVGDRVDAKVLSFDKHASLLVLSIKALEIDEEKKVIAEFGSADSGASLGDILGAALSKKD